jgi:uncharacterized repeat protein (TIGR01451 family)
MQRRENMWRKAAICIGLPLILLGIVAVVTTGALADARGMPLRAEASPPTTSAASQQPPSIYAAAADVPHSAQSQVTTFVQGVDGYRGCADTRISAERPDENFGNKELVLGMRGRIGTLIRFVNLHDRIPGNAIVLSATLGLYCHNYDRPEEAGLSICAAYPVTRAWEEMEATWYKAVESDEWGQAGCNDTTTDRSPTALDEEALHERDRWYTWNVKSAVQDWVRDSASNKGVLIRQTNDEPGEYDIRESEWPGPEVRPYLAVEYYVPPRVEIRVSKELSDPPGAIAVSDTLTFTLRITNTGDTTITSVALTDTYDSNVLTLTSWSEEPDQQEPGIINWTDSLNRFLPLGPGEHLVLTVDFHATAATAPSSTINCVYVRASDQDDKEVTDESCAEVVVSEPAIDVTKELTDPSSGIAAVSDTITFALRISNIGDIPITSLTVSDTYDSGFLTLTSWSEEPDQQEPGVINWSDSLGSLLPLAPGELLVLTVDFRVTAPTTQTAATNCVYVQARDRNENTAADEACDEVRITEPAITVAKELTSPPTSIAVVSDTITFTLRVTNVGDTAVTSLTVSDTYDSDVLTLISCSEEPDLQAPGVINWTNSLNRFLPLVPGQDLGLTLEFHADAPADPTTNTVTAWGVDEYEQSVGPEEDYANVQIVPRVSGIAVAKDLIDPPSGTVVVSDTATFMMQVTNSGDSIISSLTMTDTYDSNVLTLTSWSEEPDSQAPGIINWTNSLSRYLPLLPKTSFAVTVAFHARAPADLTSNTITVSGVDEYGRSVGPEQDDAAVQIRGEYRLYLPMFTGEVKCSPQCAQWNVLDEGFDDDSALNDWQLDRADGTIEVTDEGWLHLSAQQSIDHFPLVWQNLEDLGPCFCVELRFRHTNLAPYGTTITLNSKNYDGGRAGGEQRYTIPGIEDILSIHHVCGKDYFFQIRLIREGEECGEWKICHQPQRDDCGWHTVKVTYESGQYTLEVDDVYIDTVTSALRPSSIYIGSHVLQDTGELGPWTELWVDYVRIGKSRLAWMPY